MPPLPKRTNPTSRPPLRNLAPPTCRRQEILGRRRRHHGNLGPRRRRHQPLPPHRWHRELRRPLRFLQRYARHSTRSQRLPDRSQLFLEEIRTTEPRPPSPMVGSPHRHDRLQHLPRSHPIPKALPPRHNLQRRHLQMTPISGFRPAFPKPPRLRSSLHVIVMGGPKPKVPVIALLAPVRKDLQHRARHSLYDSPSPGFADQMAAAPWTALLLARTH